MLLLIVLHTSFIERNICFKDNELDNAELRYQILHERVPADIPISNWKISQAVNLHIVGLEFIRRV